MQWTLEMNRFNTFLESYRMENNLRKKELEQEATALEKKCERIKKERDVLSQENTILVKKLIQFSDGTSPAIVTNSLEDPASVKDSTERLDEVQDAKDQLEKILRQVKKDIQTH